MKRLILVMDKKMYFFPFLKMDSNIELSSYYDGERVSKHNFLFRYCQKRNSRLLSYFYSDWSSKLSDFSEIILFDYGYNLQVSEYIKRKNPSCKITLYFWNKINPFSEKFFSYSSIDRFSTYSKTDAENYHINFADTFYSMNMKNEEVENLTIKRDVFFIGKDKNRRIYLNNAIDFLKKNKLSNDIRIIGDNVKGITYNQNLIEVSQSKVLLDIVEKGDEGLTLRIMEAICFSKKIISNNKSLLTSSNIDKLMYFILNLDDEDEFTNFIDREIPEYVYKKAQDYYSFENWLVRVMEDKKI